MKTPTHRSGAPCWIDLGTPDIDAARAFYGALFGWEGEPGPPETGGYVNFTLQGQMVAGAMPLMDANQPPAWTVYFKTDDAEASVKAVEQSGGRTLSPPMKVMEFGTMAICAGPEGAHFGIWQPNLHQGFGAMGDPGTPCWFELNTADGAAARSFYEGALGWTASDEAMPGGTYTTVTAPGAEMAFGGITAPTPDVGKQTPSLWRPYFAVENADASTAKAVEKGGKAVIEPTDIPSVGRFAALQDPWGASFSVLTPG
ncbi:hypothetical protein BIV57_20235 [Mangrovactinospora gilvigrisea]|uniref:VOC domain-containing protein n=1 Tax=Mangrovactinospora gilvigrisea TaxID=1428644 RepID=A0A1J7BAG8_9ACTN|nr:VOC family protein [Mangrovactinospora gilvigrisea]OIV35687.1 hypothetical protein BIV57_20235 [Mangrovactinospora gilvigrisea]